MLDATAALTYVAGSAIFIVGSVYFLPSDSDNMFILGSCLFIVGAIILNAMQSYDASSIWSTRYLNLTAMSYVIGSTMFLCASVPYTFDFADDYDTTIIDRYLAVLYIIGSIFFTIGGSINWYQAGVVMKQERKQEEAPAPAVEKGGGEEEEDELKESDDACCDETAAVEESPA